MKNQERLNLESHPLPRYEPAYRLNGYFGTLSIVREQIPCTGDKHDTCDTYHVTQDTQEMANIVSKQGQGYQCGTLGVKLESHTKSLKIITNLKKQKKQRETKENQKNRKTVIRGRVGKEEEKWGEKGRNKKKQEETSINKKKR